MQDKKSALAVRFDGLAHQDNTVAIAVLVDSLQGMSELITTANSILNGDSSQIKVTITGFKKGSFEYFLDVSQATDSLINVLEVLGLSSAALAGSALSVIKKLKGRRIDAVEEHEGQFKLYLDDDCIECSKDVERLVTDQRIRKAIHNLVYKPTSYTGTEIIQIHDGNGLLILDEKKATASSYKAPKNVYSSSVTKKEFEATVKFLTAHSDSDKSWRIDHLGKKYDKVRIEDEAFLSRIQGQTPNLFGESFTVLLEEVTKEEHGKNPIVRMVIKKVYHKSLKG